MSDDFHKTKPLSAEFVSVIAFLKFLEKLGVIGSARAPFSYHWIKKIARLAGR